MDWSHLCFTQNYLLADCLCQRKEESETIQTCKIGNAEDKEETCKMMLHESYGLFNFFDKRNLLS